MAVWAPRSVKLAYIAKPFYAGLPILSVSLLESNRTFRKLLDSGAVNVGFGVGLHISPPQSICGHDKVDGEEFRKNARRLSWLCGPICSIVKRKVAWIIWLVLEKKRNVLLSWNQGLHTGWPLKQGTIRVAM